MPFGLRHAVENGLGHAVGMDPAQLARRAVYRPLWCGSTTCRQTSCPACRFPAARLRPYRPAVFQGRAQAALHRRGAPALLLVSVIAATIACLSAGISGRQRLCSCLHDDFLSQPRSSSYCSRPDDLATAACRPVPVRQNPGAQAAGRQRQFDQRAAGCRVATAGAAEKACATFAAGHAAPCSTRRTRRAGDAGPSCQTARKKTG